MVVNTTYTSSTYIDETDIKTKTVEDIIFQQYTPQSLKLNITVKDIVPSETVQGSQTLRILLSYIDTDENNSHSNLLIDKTWDLESCTIETDNIIDFAVNESTGFTVADAIMYGFPLSVRAVFTNGHGIKTEAECDINFKHYPSMYKYDKPTKLWEYYPAIMRVYDSASNSWTISVGRRI